MTSEKAIELDVQLEMRDYLRANYWFLFQSIGMKALSLFALLSLASAAYLGAFDPGVRGPALVFPLLLPGVVLLKIASVYFGAKRSWATNKSLQEAIVYRFSTSGIEAVAPSSSGRTDWGNLFKAVETRHNFLLFISRNQMYTIPKRCFGRGEQLLAFRELLRDQMAERAVLKPD